jgi:hypothetical protein
MSSLKMEAAECVEVLAAVNLSYWGYKEWQQIASVIS